MRSTEGTTGTGKCKRRRGETKGLQPTQQTQQRPRTQTGREEKERGDGKAGRHMTTPVEVEGMVGNEPGYTPTPEDLRLREVYGDWVHVNHGTHLDGGVRDDLEWQAWWRDLAVMTLRCYDAPSGRVGRRFVGTLGAELKGCGTDCGTRGGSLSFRR